jgi:hypothetical protein
MRNIFALFGKNKKRNKMEITENGLEEARSLYNGMEFQWIKGDDMMSTELFKDVRINGDNMFIEFQSGKRINSELLEEFMTYFPAAPRSPQNISQPNIQVLPTVHKTSTVTDIAYDEQSPKRGNENSPIYNLLRKQKKNVVEVSIKIKLNLPPRDLYGVLSSSFDDADNEIINFVLDGVDIDDIKTSLGESIKKSYYLIPDKKDLVKEKPTKNSSNTRNTRDEEQG